MHQGDEPGLRAQCPFERVWVDEAGCIGLDARDFNSQFAAQFRQRTQNRIVLDGRGDDVVAGLKQPVQRLIQAVGAVERENNAIGTFGAQQLGDSFAAAADDGGGLHGRAIGAAPDGGPVFAIVFVDGRINGFGLGKTCRRVVEINCQPPIEYIGR